MRGFPDSRHSTAPLFLALRVVAIAIAVLPFWTAAQTPPATLEATSQPSEHDPPATIDATTGETADQTGTTTGDIINGTPSGTGDTQDSTAVPTELPLTPTDQPLTPTESVVMPTPAAAPATPTTTATPAMPNTDTLTPTSDTAPVTIQPDQSRQYAFTYAVTTPRTGTTVHAELRMVDGGPATGWLLQVLAGGGALAGDGPATDATESSTLTPGGTFPLTVIAHAPATATAPQTVSLYIRSTATTERGEAENAVVGNAPVAALTVAPPPTSTPTTRQLRGQAALAAAIYSWAGCDQGTTYQSTPQLIMKYQCQGFTGNQSGNYFYDLTVSSLTSGWRYQYSKNGTYNASNWSQATGTSLENKNHGISSFYLYVGPTGSASYGEVTLSITAASDPTDKYEWTIRVGTKRCNPTVGAGSITFPDSTWNGTGYPATSGNVAFQISASTDSGCSGLTNGWTIQVSTAGMTGSGSSIPSSATSYTGQVSSTQGVTPVSGSVTLSFTPQTIATGSTSVSNGAIWSASFRLQPPNSAPPGTYTGSITVTVGSGS